jgi:hypothetical protein
MKKALHLCRAFNNLALRPGLEPGTHELTVAPTAELWLLKLNISKGFFVCYGFANCLVNLCWTLVIQIPNINPPKIKQINWLHFHKSSFERI